MNEALRNAGNLTLLGGRLCLDFANTVDWHASEHPVEFLHGYPDLVAWSRHAGIIDEETAQRLIRQAANHRAEAAQVLTRAVDLREAIYRIFSRVAAGRPPDPRTWPWSMGPWRRQCAAEDRAEGSRLCLGVGGRGRPRSDDLAGGT